MKRSVRLLPIALAAALTAACGTEAGSRCSTVACGANAGCDETTGVCVCNEGFTGNPALACERAASCKVDTCGGHGLCRIDSGQLVCDCDLGYTGERCTQCEAGFVLEGALCVPDACSSGYCSSHGRCSLDASGQASCACDAGYAGDRCDACAVGFRASSASPLLCVADPCAEDPCSGHGTCSVGATGEALCDCETGWTGDTCGACATDFAPENGACVDSKSVPCSDAAPDHATSVSAEVTVTYTTAGGWTRAADCAWSCDVDYDLADGSCINSRQAGCTDAAPQHATSIPADVTVTYTSAFGWTEPAVCAWSCDTDYDRLDQNCVDSKAVPCADVAPPNASSTPADVTVTFTSAGGWTLPADCAWSCDTDFALETSACIDSKQVPCADAAPAHATSTPAQVTITYSTAAGWSAPADCAWSCDTDFILETGACIDSKQVACLDNSPDNATATPANVTISYTSAGGWSAAADCAWSCDPDFAREADACIDTKLVACIEAAPAHATSVPGEVPVTYTTLGGWTAAADCAWSCDPDYALEAGACINAKTVACTDVAPANATSTIVSATVTYTSAGGWTTAPDCTWSCNTDYALDAGACIDSKQVACTDVAPAHATSILANVTVTYTSAGGWTTPADCAWSCVTDYTLEGGACIHSKQVTCKDAAPANAISILANVTITFTTAGGWAEPADCLWNCITDYARENGACINSKQVACNDAAPPNATSTLADVTITYTSAGGWTTAADCAWSCNTDYALEAGLCIHSKLVACADAAPAHATAIPADVTITYTSAGGWSDPAECSWNCDTDYALDAGACIDSKQVSCLDVAPLDATSILEPVTVTYTTAGGWTAATDCVWACDTAFHRFEQECLADVTFSYCGVTWPETLDTSPGQPEMIFGQVYSEDAGGTATVGHLRNIIGMACYAPSSLTLPLDVGALTCVDALYNGEVVNNDEHMATVEFPAAGSFDVLYAFSGDGGTSWAFCDKAGILGTTTIAPLVVTVAESSPPNGGFETWDATLTSPTDWTADSAGGVLVHLETTTVHSGSRAVRLERAGANGDTDFTSANAPVVAGTTYRIGMWFYDDTADARGRLIYEWFDAGSVSLGLVYSSLYSVDQAAWQELTETVAAPVGAAFVRVSTRVYTEGASTGGSVVLDDVTIVAQ